MPDPTTGAPANIPYPVGSDFVANGPAEMQALAVAANSAFSAFTLSGVLLTGVNATAPVGSVTVVTGNASVTITLPTPVSGSSVVLAVENTGTGAVTVSSPVVVIGPGMPSVTTFQLSSLGAFIVLREANGAWIVIAGQQDSGWINATVQNSFTGTPQYRLVGDLVHVRGSVTSPGSGPGVAFTLPAGFRPTQNRTPAMSSPGTCLITNGGAVTLTTVGAESVALDIAPHLVD